MSEQTRIQSMYVGRRTPLISVMYGWVTSKGGTCARQQQELVRSMNSRTRW